jgi:4-hydroxyproline epimerase
MAVRLIQVIDSHTEGEPTRVVVSGGPDLGAGTIAERAARFRADHDTFRSAVVNEPRGSDVLVGALLCEPSDPANTAAVIYFNNVGLLGMCGHGTIGLLVTLAHLGRIKPGFHRIETPVGVVTAVLHGDLSVSMENVASYRAAKDVAVELDNGRRVRGDVAWGGNWFFLVAEQEHQHTLDLQYVGRLTEYCWKLRQAINSQGYPRVDHVELFGPPLLLVADARNFVLCPGKAYDRSPCGTGTSAKVACLAEDGKLSEAQSWLQESIIGSTFTARYRREGTSILPTINGMAFVTAEATLILDDRDPFHLGIRR